MAYSQGFHPHPKISYANSAPTGVASEAEYVEISVTQVCDPDAVRRALDEQLPPGLDVIDVVEARAGDFAQRLEASIWQVELPEVDVATATGAAEALMAADEVVVERLTKNGMRAFDARGAVVGLSVRPAATEPPYAILDMVVRHGTPSVRPDDVITALRLVADLVPPKPPRVTRLAQGPWDAAGFSVQDPFAPDRAG